MNIRDARLGSLLIFDCHCCLSKIVVYASDRNLCGPFFTHARAFKCCLLYVGGYRAKVVVPVDQPIPNFFIVFIYC
jgi:hypothetical protein